MTSPLETVQDLRARHERETREFGQQQYPQRTHHELHLHAMRQAAELLACAQGWQDRAKGLERDAERYRWLRDTDEMPFNLMKLHMTGSKLDTAIDTAKEQS